MPAKRTTAKKRTTKSRGRKTAKTTRRSTARATGRRGPQRGIRRATPKQPFSLILEPSELSALKKMAKAQQTSVAAIIRQALHTVIFRNNPDLAKAAIENEVNSFLDQIGTKLPLGQGGARRAKLKKQMVSGLLGGMKTR